MPEYFDRYIDLVDDVELEQAFDDSIRQLADLDTSLLTRLDGKRYAPDKWTIKDILQHVIDFERILTFRTLLFARSESTKPPGIDEQQLAAGANAGSRSIDDLIDEMKTVRSSTKTMFKSFDDEMLQKVGVNWKYEISVLAMGFNMIGHQKHHLGIIAEKYYPLVKE